MCKGNCNRFIFRTEKKLYERAKEILIRRYPKAFVSNIIILLKHIKQQISDAKYKAIEFHVHHNNKFVINMNLIGGN